MTNVGFAVYIDVVTCQYIILPRVYVTVSGETCHIAIFAKIAIALYLSSTTIELTLLQV